MAAETQIAWCDSTFNPWLGCSKVSPGCDNCYAEAMLDHRLHLVQWGPHGQRSRTGDRNWAHPKRWEREHEAFFAAHGRRRRVFCASQADVFDNQVPEAWREDLWRLVAATPHLDWLLLTKRIANVRGMVPPAWLEIGAWPAHVRLGISVVNQQEADRDIVKLLALHCPNFLSMEPLLSAVDLSKIPLGGHGHHEFDPIITANVLKRRDAYPPLPRVHWVIVGGESGVKARPIHPDWVHRLREQCAAANTPFFFKQWGEWLPISELDDVGCNALYRSRVKAKAHEDQGNLDDVYGRECIVPQLVLRGDGRHVEIDSPLAFLQGTAPMQAFRVGKKQAGDRLGGAQHQAWPKDLACHS